MFNIWRVSASLAPQFTDATPVVIQAKVGEPTFMLIDVIDPDVDQANAERLNVSASITNSAGVEQLTQTELEINITRSGGDIHFQSSLTWTPAMRDVYTLELIVTNLAGVTTVMKTEIILCGCNQLATCDYTQPQVCDCFLL